MTVFERRILLMVRAARRDALGVVRDRVAGRGWTSGLIRATGGARPACGRTGTSGNRSEVELVDVAGVEDGGRPEDDRRADSGGRGENRVFAELPGLELGSRVDGGDARGQRCRCVAGEVAQVTGVPQLERLDGAVLDVRLHLRRQSEAGERDLDVLVRGQ